MNRLRHVSVIATRFPLTGISLSRFQQGMTDSREPRPSAVFLSMSRFDSWQESLQKMKELCVNLAQDLAVIEWGQTQKSSHRQAKRNLSSLGCRARSRAGYLFQVAAISSILCLSSWLLLNSEAKEQNPEPQIRGVGSLCLTSELLLLFFLNLFFCS